MRDVCDCESMALELIKARCKWLNWSWASCWRWLLSASWLEHLRGVHNLLISLSQVVRRLSRGRCFKPINQILSKSWFMEIIWRDSRIELTFFLPSRFKVESHSLIWPALSVLVGKPSFVRIEVLRILSTWKELVWLRIIWARQLMLRMKSLGVLGFKLGSSSLFTFAHGFYFGGKQ